MSHVPLSTMSRLSALKLAEIDPAQVRVAARMPERIEPRRGGVKVSIAVGTPAAAKLEFILEPAPEPQELAGLARFQRPGERLWSYRLSAADVVRLQRALAGAGAAQSSVSIAAGVDACRRDQLGTAPLPTTTFLRTDAAGFMVLTEDLDLRSVVPARDLATKIAPCS